MVFFLPVFQNALFLVGVSAAAIPVLLHLIYRRRAPRIMFSTLRFLRVSNQRTSARRRLQNLLLLLLRAALLALLAIALARPFIPSARSSSFGRSATGVAIVLDNSYSMATRMEAVSRFARAQHMAQGVLGRLQLGDSAAVLFAAPPRGAPAPALSGDLNNANVQVAKATVSNARGDLPDAVRRGLELLARSKDVNRELYVITDLQKAAWNVDEEDAEAAFEAYRDIAIILADVGQGTCVNLSVAAAQVKSAAGVANAPLVVAAKLHNSSPRAIDQKVSFFLDGRKVDEKDVSLPPGTTLTLPFSHLVESAGTHTGDVRLADDALSVDNRASFQVHTREQIEALIVRGAASAVSFYNPEFYLRLALNPFGSTGGGTIRPTTIGLPELDFAALEGKDVAFFAGVGGLTADRLAPVRAFVYRGGSAVFFAGDEVDANAYTFAFAEGETGTGAESFFPAEFGEPRTAEQAGKPFVAIASVEQRHPMFKFLSSRDLLTLGRTYKWLTVELPPDSATAVLATLENGDPLLLEHPYGRGRVLWFTTSADTTWTNLPVTNLFLPWMQQLCRWVATRPREEHGYYVGSSVRFPFPDRLRPVPVKVAGPDGVATQVTSRPTASGNDAVFEATDRPGIYSYVVGEGEERGSFVVNADPREADLTRIAPDTLKSLFDERPFYVVSSVAEMNRAIDRMRQGISLHVLLFLIVLVLAVLESVVSNRAARGGRVSTSQHGRPLASETQA